VIIPQLTVWSVCPHEELVALLVKCRGHAVLSETRVAKIAEHGRRCHSLHRVRVVRFTPELCLRRMALRAARLANVRGCQCAIHLSSQRMVPSRPMPRKYSQNHHSTKRAREDYSSDLRPLFEVTAGHEIISPAKSTLPVTLHADQQPGFQGARGPDCRNACDRHRHEG
jgi:hypothetical protein